MADNVAISAGSGTTIATDEIGGAHYQRIKLASGADGTASDVSADAPLPVGAQRTEDLLVLLSRVVKLLESNAVVDQQQRQRITLDSVAPNLTLGSISTVSTVATVNNVAAQTSVAGMDREMYINQARQAYATGIRAQLQFV